MDSQEIALNNYLEELHRQTGDNLETQVSMYDIGAAIGLEKGEAGSLAEQLIVQGLAELKTLAGGIAITEEGLAHLGIRTTTSSPQEGSFQLSGQEVASDTDRETMQKITDKLRNDLSGLDLSYQQLEEIVLNLKTIDVYMLSPRPRLAVLREIFRSLQEIFELAGANTTATLLRGVFK